MMLRSCLCISRIEWMYLVDVDDVWWCYVLVFVLNRYLYIYIYLVIFIVCDVTMAYYGMILFSTHNGRGISGFGWQEILPKWLELFRLANSYDSFRTLQKPWQIQEVFIGPVTQLVEKDPPVWGGTWPILPNLCKWGIASRRLARGGPWPPWGFSKMFEPRGPKDHPKPILITSLRMSVSPIFNKIIK